MIRETALEMFFLLMEGQPLRQNQVVRLRMVYKDTIYKRVSEDIINATVNVFDDIKRFFATEVALVINFPLGLTVIGCLKTGKVCFRANWPIRPEPIPVSVA